jgi:hypothetical protein
MKMDGAPAPPDHDDISEGTVRGSQRAANQLLPGDASTMIYVIAADNPSPSGGDRHTYEFVDALNQIGHAATAWHGKPGFRHQWFKNSTRVVNAMRLTLSEGDLLICPEILTAGGAPTRLQQARVVILNMNHFYMLRGAGFEDTWPGDYPGWPNAVAVIAVSQAVRDFAARTLRAPLPVHHVPLVVRTGQFKPAARKEKLIVTMPRKRVADMETVVQALLRSPHLAGWRIEVADKLRYEDWAQLLSRASIFLSASDRESLGYPPAEAMSAGCYVIGFTGDGGREYMNPAYCSVIEDPNVLQFVLETERVVANWDSHQADFQHRIAMARRFIETQYSHESMLQALRNSFEQLTAPGSPARQPAPAVVRHYSDEDQPVRAWARGMAKRWLPPVMQESISRQVGH